MIETDSPTTSPLLLPDETIRQVSRLEIAIQEMAREPAIALDTESNSFHHYPEQLCLIQIATRYKVYVIDTITLKDILPLKRVLEDDSIKKVVHGADYDIRSLDRHSGFHIRNLYDTNVAARFAGMTRVGLAVLIEYLLHVVIPKSKRLQRADWGRRPLSTEALSYAAADVRYLLPLQEVLEQRLQELGRSAWAAEEYVRLEDVRYTVPDPEAAYLSAKGARDLDERGLAILQSLFRFREEEARRRRQPPFFVIPEATLVSIAAKPTIDLAEAPGINGLVLRRYGQGLTRAIREGLAAPLIVRTPVAVERASNEEMERLRGLKAWRAALGESLSLDPSLLWPTTSLERLAKAPDTLDSELASPNIRRWQRENFAASLRVYLQSLA